MNIFVLTGRNNKFNASGCLGVALSYDGIDKIFNEKSYFLDSYEITEHVLDDKGNTISSSVIASN